MVLALSNEDSDTVSTYMDENGYSVRTAAGATSGGDYGVSGIPASFLIDTDGKVLWSGHPMSLSSGKIKDALKGARKPSDQEFLVFDVDLGSESQAVVEASSELRSAQELFLEGKPAKALSALEKLSAAAADNPALLAAVAELQARAQKHQELIDSQVAAAIARLDLITATEVLEVQVKEFGDSPAGKAAKDQLTKIDKDERLKGELDAALALQRTIKSADKLATSKKRKKYDDFAKKYEGTRAGSRAAGLSRALAAK